MSWETTGTVTVTNNSATVTGSGTLFTVKSRVGDAFIGPDGALYEIVNIVSNTVLSISPTYKGVTGSAKAYKIAPVRGYQKLSADRLYTIVNTIGDAVEVVTDLPAWLKAKQPTPVSAGGTGAETQLAARQNLGLKGAAVLDIGTAAGTVAAGDDSRLVGAAAESSVATRFAGKVDKVTGKVLSDQNYTLIEKNKLGAVAIEATKNSTDAQLRDRGTHTGTQAVGTITGLGNAATRNVGAVAGTVAAGDDVRILGAFQKSDIAQALGNSQDKVVSQDALTRVLGALNPLPSSFTWNELTDTKVYHHYNPANAPQECMRRCVQNDALEVVYYLDPFDSSKKADGTSANLTGVDGQVMLEIPQTFVSVRKVGDNITWSTSLVPIPGFVLHPAFLEGGELYFDVSLGFYYYKNVTKVHQFIYYSAYMPCVEKADGSYIGGLNLDNNDSRLNYSLDKLSSISGGYPMVGVTHDQIRQLATNRGPGWQVLDFWTVALTQILYVTEYGSLNTQGTIGEGVSTVTGGYPAASSVQSDSPHSQAGKSSVAGNRTGHLNSSAKDTAWMSYRGIENWYGNAWQSVDGVMFLDRQAFIGNKPSLFTQNTSNYASIGSPLPSSGYIRRIQGPTLSFLPSVVAGGASSIAFSDYVYTEVGLRVGWFGGAASTGVNAGGFCLYALAGGGGRGQYLCARFINKK